MYRTKAKPAPPDKRSPLLQLHTFRKNTRFNATNGKNTLFHQAETSAFPVMGYAKEEPLQSTAENNAEPDDAFLKNLLLSCQTDRLRSISWLPRLFRLRQTALAGQSSAGSKRLKKVESGSGNGTCRISANKQALHPQRGARSVSFRVV